MKRVAGAATSPSGEGCELDSGLLFSGDVLERFRSASADCPRNLVFAQQEQHFTDCLQQVAQVS